MPPAPLVTRLWRSQLRTVAVPLLVLGIALVVVVLVDGWWISTRTTAALGMASEREQERLVAMEAEAINAHLGRIGQGTGLLALAAVEALSRPATDDPIERERYARNAAGVLHSPRDDGRAAVHYSRLSRRPRIGPAELDQLQRSAAIDPLMRAVVRDNHLVSACYLNTADGLTRIWPWLEVTRRLAPDADPTTFGFYYLADAQHNPERTTVWTEPHLDPTGNGWVLSCIAPVYLADRLAGVVGSDVTLATLIGELLQRDRPGRGYGMLVAANGTLVAMSHEAEREFALLEVNRSDTGPPVTGEVHKPTSHHLERLPGLGQSTTSILTAEHGALAFQLDSGETRRAAWATIPTTGWRLLLVLDPQTMAEPVRTITHGQLWAALGVLLAVIGFALACLAIQRRRAERLGRMFLEPLAEVDALIERVAKGAYQQDLPDLRLIELHRTAGGIVAMGRQLAERTERLEAALRARSRFLDAMSHEIRTPLNGIIGLAELLRFDANLNPEQKDQVELILASGERLLLLLDSVLLIAQLESGALVPETTEVSPRDLLDQVVSRLGMIATTRGVVLHSQMEANTPEVWSLDPKLAGRSLDLLVHCALHVPGNRHVWVRARPTDEGGMELTADLDTPPPRPEVMERLFDDRDSGLFGAMRDGAGLGMAVVRRLATLTGGTASAMPLERGWRLVLRFRRL